jgi:hypothetical protein
MELKRFQLWTLIAIVAACAAWLMVFRADQRLAFPRGLILATFSFSRLILPSFRAARAARETPTGKQLVSLAYGFSLMAFALFITVVMGYIQWFQQCIRGAG